MPLLPVPIPIDSPIAKRRDFDNYPLPKRSNEPDRPDPNDGMLPKVWVDFMSFQSQSIEAAVQRAFLVSLTGQSAGIGATDITNGTLTTGLYTLKYYVRVTQAAGVTSSIQIDIDWKDGGITQTLAGTAQAGNTTTTLEQKTYFLHIDGGSPVRYTATYASNPASAMQYALYIVLERISA